MSAPHIILDSLPSLYQKFHLCIKNYQIWWKFNTVITKIILLVFYLDVVYNKTAGQRVNRTADFVTK